MNELTNDRNLHTGSEDDHEEPVFNCAPVKKVKLQFDISKIRTEQPRIPEGLKDIGIRFNSRRQVTIHARIQGISTGYVDQDTSGTYDPKLERATPPPAPVPRSRRRKTLELDENGEPILRCTTKRVGYGFPLVITFGSVEGRDYLRSITPGPYSSDSSDAEDEHTDSQNFHDSVHRSLKRPKKRRRTTKAANSFRSDGLTIDQLSIGHPQRRGCKACFEIGNDECSLLEDSHDYPCVACDEDGIDCELIIRPEFKGVCQRCKKKRLKCSFRHDGGKGVNECKHCEETGEDCVAGPLDECLKHKFKDNLKAGRNNSHKSSAKTTISRSKQPQAIARVLATSRSQHKLSTSNIQGLSRKFVSCNQCRESSLRCTLARNQKGPCFNCSKADEECKFVPIISRTIPSALSTSRTRTQDDSEDSGRATSPRTNTHRIYVEYLNKKRPAATKGKKTSFSENAPKSKSQSDRKSVDTTPKLVGTTLGIQHIIITTSFCHPIRFFYQPDPDNLFPCSWCDSPVFGLWGYSPREVEVIPFGGDIGNEEIRGGHSEDGKEQTKMCLKCTSQRVKTVLCQQHVIKRIDNLDPKTLDLAAVGQSMIALAQGSLAGGELIQRVKWCSLCVTPAKFRCCIGHQAEWCGLHLCQTCMDLLDRLRGSWASSTPHKRILDQLVCLWREDLWKRGGNGELRADVEFLLSSGELWTRMGKMSISKFDDDPLEKKYGEMRAQGKKFSAGQGLGSNSKGLQTRVSSNLKVEENASLTTPNQPYHASLLTRASTQGLSASLSPSVSCPLFIAPSPGPRKFQDRNASPKTPLIKGSITSPSTHGYSSEKRLSTVSSSNRNPMTDMGLRISVPRTPQSRSKICKVINLDLSAGDLSRPRSVSTTPFAKIDKNSATTIPKAINTSTHPLNKQESQLTANSTSPNPQLSLFSSTPISTHAINANPNQSTITTRTSSPPQPNQSVRKSIFGPCKIPAKSTSAYSAANTVHGRARQQQRDASMIERGFARKGSTFSGGGSGDAKLLSGIPDRNGMQVSVLSLGGLFVGRSGGKNSLSPRSFTKGGKLATARGEKGKYGDRKEEIGADLKRRDLEARLEETVLPREDVLRAVVERVVNNNDVLGAGGSKRDGKIPRGATVIELSDGEESENEVEVEAESQAGLPSDNRGEAEDLSSKEGEKN